MQSKLKNQFSKCLTLRRLHQNAFFKYLVTYEPHFLFMWVPLEIKVEPQFLKSNCYLLFFCSFSLFHQQLIEEENYCKKKKYQNNLDLEILAIISQFFQDLFPSVPFSRLPLELLCQTNNEKQFPFAFGHLKGKIFQTILSYLHQYKIVQTRK